MEEDHGQCVGEGRPTALAEFVQVENYGDAPRPGSAHQFEAGRMPAPGEQHAGREAVDHLVDHVEKDSTVCTVRRPLRLAGAGGHHCHGKAVDVQTNRPGQASAAQQPQPCPVGCAALTHPRADSRARTAQSTRQYTP